MAEKHCMGCMRGLNVDAMVCPHCGFDASQYIPPEMTLPLGTTLANGKYLIGKTLGQGGFGVTYIALDRFLKLRVAIKEYLPKSMAYRSESSASLHWHSSMAEQKLGRDSFVKEAQKMAQMDDIPGIVRVREVFYENNTAYIVMDYVEGETLLKRLEKTGALDGKVCFELLRPVMDSLAEAHQQGMIHRDISPDNIMLDRRGRIWLLDMGAAKEISVAPSEKSEHSSSVAVVKNGFSPLEQYAVNPADQSADKKNIGAWTDVYAMSATIFYCMSLSMLPPAPYRVLNPLLELPDIIPPEIARVLLKGLEVKPQERIRGMEELRDALAAAVGAADDSEAHQKAEAEARRQEEEYRQAEEEARRREQECREKEEERRREEERLAALGKAQLLRKEREQKEKERKRAEEKRNKKAIWTFFAVVAAIVAGIALINNVAQSSVTPSTATESISTPTTPASIVASGTSDTGLTWELDENGLLTISGTGEMHNFTYQEKEKGGIDWLDYRNQIKLVKIENGVTTIGEHAFEGCINLTNITIPNSVTRIQESAFQDCDSLSYIAIPTGVTEIGSGAFSGCTHLSEIAIPDGVTEIAESSFFGCSSLKSVIIPNSVSSVGAYAFSDCSSLSDITIPDSVIELGIETIIPGIDTSLSSGHVFSGCTSLSSIVIPNSVTKISEFTFYNCTNLSNVVIPDSVTIIERCAFAGCSVLSSIAIPDGVTEIGEGAFESCSSLSSVIIPDSVVEIGTYAFSACENLTSIDITICASIIREGTFAGCTSLSSVTIPYGVTTIEGLAFSVCNNLSNITLPDSVMTIESEAFYGCDSLKNVSIPAGAEIAEDAFPETTVVTVRGGENSPASTAIVASGTSDTGLTWELDENGLLTISGTGEMRNFLGMLSSMCRGIDWWDYKTRIQSVKIENGVTTTGSYAFSDCSSLSSVTIPDSVTTIGSHAFSGCSSLSSVNIPDGVTIINVAAFSGCTSLSSVVIPNSVMTIESEAFYGCSSLESVSVPAGAKITATAFPETTTVTRR